MKLRNILAIFFVCGLFSNSFSQASSFDNLLKMYVDSNGNVDYACIKKNEDMLDQYLDYLSKTSPEGSWSSDKQKAFWINAYNAYTIKVIVDNYPVKSITDIKEKGKTAWKHPFAVVGGETYTLDHIEHQILRPKFKDPRIHVGVNCASISCPKLANYAFTESNIDEKLDQLMSDFINDPSRNQIDTKQAKLSEIFNWFASDFEQNGSLIEYINSFSEIKMKDSAKISYLSYNWGLNGK